MPTNTVNRRNLSAECLKLIASFCVVFIHVTFPGRFGSLIHYLSGFAVPAFFTLTGYFNYGADCKAIQRRTKHILDLLLAGTLLHLVWDCIYTELNNGSTIAYLRAWIFDPIEIVNMVVLSLHPYANHLWYLISLLMCYGLLWINTRFYPEGAPRYHGLYTLGLGLGIVLLLFGIVTPSDVISGNFQNSIPWFVLGLFLGAYRERILSQFGLTRKRLLGILAVSLAFSALHWSCSTIGTMTFGTPFTVLALVLLVLCHPDVPRWLEKPARHFGAISTWIYITHLVVGFIYANYLLMPLANILGGAEPWLRPLIVLALSFLAAVVVDQLSLLRKRRGKKA